MYTTLENAYKDNTSELDKMAKALNKKKDNLFKSEEGEFDRVEKKWKQDIIAYNNHQKYKDNYYYNDNNNYTNINNENINNENINNENINNENINNENINNENNNFENMSLEDISIDSISLDSPTIDSYIESIKSDTTKSSPMHKMISNLNNEECSKDSEDIYDHIKTCKECKLKLLKYISTSHTNIKKNKRDYYEDIYKKRKSLFNYFGEIENKEIIVIIFLGIFIIIILDFIMKGVKNKV
jgi:hypothetical protein